MKQQPTYGYYPWWPEDGDQWLHPDDVELARTLIPGPRIFRREATTGEFDVLHYRDIQLRVRRALWREVQGEGFELGDWVEVRSRGMQNTPCTAVIREMHWSDRHRAPRYWVQDNDKQVPTQYAAEDLQRVEPTIPLPDPTSDQSDC